MSSQFSGSDSRKPRKISNNAKSVGRRGPKGKIKYRIKLRKYRTMQEKLQGALIYEKGY